MMYSGKKRFSNMADVLWYSFLVPKTGRTSLISETPNYYEKFIVCFQNEYRYYAVFNNTVDFLNKIKYLPHNEWHFYEIILGENSQKLYFDIDKIKLGESDKLITALVTAIIEVFKRYGLTVIPEKHILLFNSNNSEIQSYHLIVDGFSVISNRANAILSQEIIDLISEEMRVNIDDRMYSKKQQFRLLMSRKFGSDRVKKIMLTWNYGDKIINYNFTKRSAPTLADQEAFLLNSIFSKTCISNTVGCKMVPVIIPIEMPVVHETLVLTELMVENIYNRIDKDIFKVYNIAEITDGEIILRRKIPAYCTICNREHKSDNAMLSCEIDGEIYFICRRSPSKPMKITSICDLIINDESSIIYNHLKSLNLKLIQPLVIKETIIYEKDITILPSKHSELRELASTKK